jgi:hypothetical protein
MPPVLPVLPLMMAELSLMALVASLLRRKLGLHVILATAATLVVGRVVMGLTVFAAVQLLPHTLVSGLPPIMLNPLTYVAAATVKAVPGLVLQMIVVPAAVLAIERVSLPTREAK